VSLFQPQYEVSVLTSCSLAYHEMRLIMAKVLYAFDFELAPESEDWNDQETFILWQKKPLICKLKAVN
jgi:cytochrome P450